MTDGPGHRRDSLTLADVVAVSRASEPPVATCRDVGARAHATARAAWSIASVGERRGRLRRQHRLRQALRSRDPAGSLAELQVNLVRSHAAGVGPLLPEARVRAMMLLRANVLAKGYSGARPALVELLLAMLNARRVSAGPGAGQRRRERRPRAARAPRARAHRRGRRCCTATRRGAGRGDCCARAGLAPVALGPKEGLALINGTQAHTAIARARAASTRTRLWQTAHVAGAMSLEALLGTPVAFDARIHDARGQLGQAASRRAAARAARRQRDPRVAPRTATRACRTRTRCAACRRCTGRCSTRIDFAARHHRARAERRDRQPARLRGRRAAERRQLPRPGGRDGARLPGDRADEPRDDLRAAHRPAGAPRLQPGAAAVPRAGRRA